MNYNYAEKYIKKPVVVEAFHYRRYCTDYRDLESFCGDSLIGVDERCSPIIKTLEGEVSLYDDCYVIKGIKGEFYPCQKEIFEMTYESLKRMPRLEEKLVELGFQESLNPNINNVYYKTNTLYTFTVKVENNKIIQNDVHFLCLSFAELQQAFNEVQKVLEVLKPCQA